MIYFKLRSGCIINSILVIILAAVFAFSSCKKEYVKYPYNNIERFTIKDATGADLKASIENNNIIVYYPPFQTIPDFINPQIVISDGAVIEPASGAKVAFKTGTVFKVKAQDGRVKTYTLKQYLSAPAPTFELPGIAQHPGVEFVLTGEFMNPDTNVSKFYLVNQANKEIQIPGSTFSKFTASALVTIIPTNIDTGIYHVKLKTGNQVLLKGPLKIDPPFLFLSTPDGVTTVKRGTELTLTTSNNSLKYYKDGIGTQATIYTGSQPSSVIVNVTSVTATEVKLAIPSNFPLATIYFLTIKNKDGSDIAVNLNGLQIVN
jgi:hypothetical protein